MIVQFINVHPNDFFQESNRPLGDFQQGSMNISDCKIGMLASLSSSTDTINNFCFPLTKGQRSKR